VSQPVWLRELSDAAASSCLPASDRDSGGAGRCRKGLHAVKSDSSEQVVRLLVIECGATEGDGLESVDRAVEGMATLLAVREQYPSTGHQSACHVCRAGF
jgi:hypothetical protein